MIKNRLVKIVKENLEYRRSIKILKDDIRILSSKCNDLEKKYNKIKKDYETLLLYYTLNEEINEKDLAILYED